MNDRFNAPDQSEVRPTTASEAAPKRNVRNWAIAGAASVLLVGGLAFTKYTQVMAAIAYGQSFPEPAQAVHFVKAERVMRAPVTTAIGELEAVERVDLTIERSGVITRINFASGDFVKRGQTLLQLDTTEERADLASAEVEAQRTRTDAEREAELLLRGAAAEAVVEQATALAAAADARVAALRTAIDRKTIRAPFSGRVGITDLRPGQYVAEGSQIATLVGSQSGIYIDFTLPQDAVASLDRSKPVRIVVAGKTIEAKIVASEPSIDAASRSLGYRALVRKYDGVLPVGSLVSVEVDTGTPQEMIVVPRTAVLRSPYGSTVFILSEKDGETRAKAQLVDLGPALGSDRVIVLSGLDADTTIAADGVFKLRDGGLVRPQAAASKAASATANSKAEPE